MLIGMAQELRRLASRPECQVLLVVDQLDELLGRRPETPRPRRFSLSWGPASRLLAVRLPFSVACGLIFWAICKTIWNGYTSLMIRSWSAGYRPMGLPRRSPNPQEWPGSESTLGSFRLS